MLIDEIYPNAPLEYAACEVRYPYSPRLAKDEAWDHLTHVMRARFPLPQKEERRQMTIGPGVPMNLATEHLYRLVNKKRTESLLVGPTSLTVETTHYDGYQSFRALIIDVVNVIAEYEPIVGIDRVGLRYIDEIRAPEPITGLGDWSAYINRSLLTFLDLLLDDYTPKGITGVIDFVTGERTGVAMRYATLEGAAVGDQPLRRRRKAADGPFFLLDIDSFWTPTPDELGEFAADDVALICDDLHTPVRTMFERAITDRLRDDVLRKGN